MIQRKYIIRFLEFFLIGFLLGMVEDLIAISISTGEPITWGIVGIIALVALPFAIFSELIVDRKDFWKFLKKEEKIIEKKIKGK